MNKIYQHNNNSHRSNVAQGSAGAGANTTRVGPQNAVTTTPSTQTTNVPNNSHGHQQQQYHHPRHHGHNSQHNQHHHHNNNNNNHHHHHHQQQQHQQHHHQQHQHPQQQQQQQQHHQQQQPQQQQSQHQPQQPQQQLHHNQHHHPQAATYMPHPANHMAPHDVLDQQHHHPQQPLPPPPPQQVQQGPGIPPQAQAQAVPQQPQQQQNNQHNPIIKHPQHTPTQQGPLGGSQVHQAQPLHHNHHNHHPGQHHHNQQHPHAIHHQPQMPISPSIQPTQWGPPQHPQQAQSSQHHHQPAQHHQQQQQQPPPQPQPPHHLNHPSAPPVLINQQYQSPNFIYTHMGHGFVPHAGHLPPYDQPQVASHQPDSVNINSQQQPVSISNHHPGNIPLSQIPAPAVISTATTGTTNVHQLNNGPLMDAHMPTRLPINAPPYMMPSPYLPPPYNLMTAIPYPMPNLNTYPGPHLQTSPAMIAPIRVSSELGIRQQYDPQNQTTPALPTTGALSQPPGVKPPIATTTASTPIIAGAPVIAPRAKKALAIVDPLTKHVFTVDELKGSPTTPQSQSSKDSGQSGISPKDPSISEKELETRDDTFSTATSDPIASDKPKQTSADIETVVNLQDTKQDVEEKQAQNITKEKMLTVKNGETNNESNIEGGNDVTDLATEVVELKISVCIEKPSEESEELQRTPVKEKSLPNLPYEVGQFSPMNPNGRRKYTTNFLKAVAKEMNIDIQTSSSPMPRQDTFIPHYHQNQNAGLAYRDFPNPQPLMRRSSQQVIAKPRKVISTHSLQQEVELKTAEKPWVPERENEKEKLIESGEMDTKRLLKVFRGHLNKLTPQKYDQLIVKINDLDLKGGDRLNSVIDLVFDKAVDEPGFCELYARMCKVIAVKDPEFCFNLLKKCQEKFETEDLYNGLNVDERKLEIGQENDIVKKKLLSEELYEDMRLRRKKHLGTIKLIGEMYKLGLLIPKIIGLCMDHLMKEPTNENFECLCSLITTVGSKMASENEDNIKSSLRNILNVLHDFASSKKTDKLFTLESRIKFKILDTIDLSRRNWKPRMVEDNPKKLDELREEVKDDYMRQQHQNHSSNQSKNLSKPDDRDRPRRLGPHGYQHKQSKWT